MAINVNTVYQTVLLILNKEQRGYLTPVEFNKIGAQAQLEIFENYFDSLNQQIRIPQTNEDYADRIVNLDEKISIFKTSGAASYVNGVFNLPTTSGATTLTQNFVVPPNNSPSPISYTISNITAAQLSQGTPVVAVNGITRSTDFNIIGNTLTFTNNSQPLPSWSNTATQLIAVNAATTNSTNFVLSNASGVAASSLMIGAIVSGGGTVGAPTITAKSNAPGPYNTSVSSIQNYAAGALLNITNNITVQTTEQDFYRLGTVRYGAGGNIPIHELQRVTRSELYHFLSSNLTKPTTTYPIYTYENNQLTIYPTEIQSGINVDYIRKPTPPKWNFTSSAATNYTYIYDSSNSINFELHPADQTELILKTLLYAGVVIEDPAVIQVAAQQVSQENINQQR